MTDVKKLFGTDAKKEQEGVWHDLAEGLRVKIARIGNPNYQKRFQAITKPYQRALRKNTLANEVAEKLHIQCLSETIVLDWEGVEDGGKEIPYSKDAAIALLTKYPELRSYINDIANELEGFQEELVEEGDENLKK
jgi:hypothetical protein